MPEVVLDFSCPGCCGAGFFEYQCRSRTGSASLCGYSEYTSPSSPPRKYKRKTLGGGITVQKWSGPGCAGSLVSGTCIRHYSGSNVFSASPSECVETFGGQVVLDGSGGEQTLPVPSITTLLCVGDANCAKGSESTYTRTRFSVRETHADGSTGCQGGCQVAGDSAFEQLTDEDTEEDAMGRAPSDWTEWGQGGCCTAKEMRGAGSFVFSFTEAEYRIRVKGTPGQIINLELRFARSNGDPYTEIRQFVALGKDYGDWQVFSIQAAPGSTACLEGVKLYQP